VKIGVIGGGSWGTALAQVSAINEEDVLLWARNRQVVATINQDHCNPDFLPGIILAPTITATTELDDLRECELLLVVTPAQHMRAILSMAIVGTRPLVLCSKGIEAHSQLLMSQVARELCPDAPIAVLSGPTFAHEDPARSAAFSSLCFK
jgi:glycerol-3-phosphate dehydrogenase (NAD(P)+)